jgi:hypothetical protein
MVRPRGEGPISSGFTPGPLGAIMGHAQTNQGSRKITFAEMRAAGLRGLLAGRDLKRTPGLKSVLRHFDCRAGYHPPQGKVDQQDFPHAPLPKPQFA